MTEFEPDDDFKLSPEQREIVTEYGKALSMVCTELTISLIAAGLSQARSTATVTNVLVQCAAGSACRTRREVLGGEPDIERWRQVTDAAFHNRAIRSRPFKVALDEG